MIYRYPFILLVTLIWTSMIAPTTLAANKIVILTSQATNSEVVKAIYQGLLDSFEQTYQEEKTTYSLNDDYQIELVNYVAGKNPLVTYSSDAEVVAILCQTSSDCQPALEESAAKNVLVIALTATSTVLADGKNILRLAPSNALQAKAIYLQLKKEGAKRFGVIYEPTVYAMDLYSALLGEYFTDIINNVEKPSFVSAFPVSDFLGLSDKQKGTTTKTVLQLLPRLNLDAIVFAGFGEAFHALTDADQGGDATLAKNWYAGDAIFPLADGFPGLRIFSLYMPDYGTSQHPQYYYAHDAGTFLKTVITAYETEVGGVPQRDKFLELAQKTTVPIEFSKTGAKSFSEADSFGRFNLQQYDALSEPPVIQETAVSAY